MLIETNIGMHIGLRKNCISTWLMLGVYDVYVLMLMYCECYVNFFIVLKLVSYDDENV